LRESIRFGYHIGPGHLLLGVLSENNDTGVQVLMNLGVDVSALQAAIFKVIEEEWKSGS
jgi:hypothetical protein